MSVAELIHERPVYVHPFAQAAPALGTEWLPSDACTEEVREGVDRYRELAEQADPADQLLMTRSLELAIPSYQFNNGESKRWRKHRRLNNPPDPYLIHPLQVALHSMGHPVLLETLTPKGIKKLYAEQYPYDARVIAASPLHDVPEDVPGIEGYEEISDPLAWKDIIVPYLMYGADGRGAQVPQERAEDVWKIIYAVTNPSPEETATLRPHILKDPFIKEVVAYLQDRAMSPELAANIPNQMVTTVAARHTLLTRTLGDDFIRLASIYTKAADRSNNMNTPGTNLAKLYDAHTIAEITRAVGLPIASELMFGLTKNGYSIGRNPGSIENDYFEQTMRGQYIDLETDRNIRREHKMLLPNIHFRFANSDDVFSYPVTANQIPVTTLGERKGSFVGDPAVQFLVSVPDRDVTARVMESRTISVTYDRSNSEFKALRIQSPLHSNLKKYGGLAIFEVIMQNGRTAFYVKFADNQPTGHDVLCKGSTVSASDVPGMKFLSRADGTINTTLEICKLLSPLR